MSMTIAYHEADPKDLERILSRGLKRTSRGKKGDDNAIIQTDELLDKNRPDEVRSIGVSRDDNLYAYLAIVGTIIDITDGTPTPIDSFVANSKQAVLELTIDPTRSYVSNLDAYDILKRAIEQAAPQQVLHRLASEYWASITRLDHYIPSQFRRPEIMITYDIEPSAIQHLTPSHTDGRSNTN